MGLAKGLDPSIILKGGGVVLECLDTISKFEELSFSAAPDIGVTPETQLKFIGRLPQCVKVMSEPMLNSDAINRILTGKTNFSLYRIRLDNMEPGSVILELHHGNDVVRLKIVAQEGECVRISAFEECEVTLLYRGQPSTTIVTHKSGQLNSCCYDITKPGEIRIRATN